jgi:hypothetical protein
MLRTVIVHKHTIYVYLFVKMADYLGRLLYGLTSCSKSMSFKVAHLREASGRQTLMSHAAT